MPDLTIDQQIRWIDCLNASGEEIPSWAVLRVTGTGTDGVLNVAKPNADGVATQNIAINSQATIPIGGYGVCTTTYPAQVAYDNAGTPAAMETWGPANGSWLLTETKAGFRIVGTTADMGPNTVMAVPRAGEGGIDLKWKFTNESPNYIYATENQIIHVNPLICDGTSGIKVAQADFDYPLTVALNCLSLVPADATQQGAVAAVNYLVDPTFQTFAGNKNINGALRVTSTIFNDHSNATSSQIFGSTLFLFGNAGLDYPSDPTITLTADHNGTPLGSYLSHKQGTGVGSEVRIIPAPAVFPAGVIFTLNSPSYPTLGLLNDTAIIYGASGTLVDGTAVLGGLVTGVGNGDVDYGTW